MNLKLKSLTFKIAPALMEAMDRRIDPIRFRSRGQIINIAISEWLMRQDAYESDRRAKERAAKRKSENTHRAEKGGADE